MQVYMEGLEKRPKSKWSADWTSEPA